MAKTKKKSSESKFGQWFSMQFGGMPISPAKMSELRKKQADLHDELVKVNQRITNQEKINAQYQAARYAHNAKDSDYNF